ncbi:MAG: hypothetical protein ACOX26_01250 [Bacilli bacterium]
MNVELIFLIIIAGIVALNILGLFIVLIVNGAKKRKHKKVKTLKKPKEKPKEKAKEETKERRKRRNSYGEEKERKNRSHRK